MYAICQFPGRQERIEPGRFLQIDFLPTAKVGETLVFDKVLLFADGKDLRIGKPYVDVKVSATVLEHGRREKVLVYHKKRRKEYDKKRGHRQKFTTIRVDSIEG